MELTLSLNTASRIIDLDRYPELNQDNDEQRLETIQTALEIGLRALTQARSTLDTQALQSFIERIIQDANASFRTQASAVLSQLAENGRQIGEQNLSQTKGTIAQITEVLETHRTAILTQLSFDTPGSAINRINDIFSQQTQQIQEALSSLKTRREVEARSPIGGMSYEQQVGNLLNGITLFAGDHCEPVGETFGTLSNCKVGDFVITLGNTRHVPNGKIVVEAKHDASYSRTKVLNECQTALQNRDAQVAIFVWDKQYAEAKKQQPIEIQGQKIVVLWDTDDPTTDVYLRAAYWMACWLIVPQTLADPIAQVHQEQVDKTFKEITSLSTRLDEIHRAAETISKQVQTILKTTDEVKALLESSVEFLQRQVGALVDKTV